MLNKLNVLPVTHTHSYTQPTWTPGPHISHSPTLNNLKPQGSSHRLYFPMWEHWFLTWLHVLWRTQRLFGMFCYFCVRKNWSQSRLFYTWGQWEIMFFFPPNCRRGRGEFLIIPWVSTRTMEKDKGKCWCVYVGISCPLFYSCLFSPLSLNLSS